MQGNPRQFAGEGFSINHEDFKNPRRNYSRLFLSTAPSPGSGVGMTRRGRDDEVFYRVTLTQNVIPDPAERDRLDPESVQGFMKPLSKGFIHAF